MTDLDTTARCLEELLERATKGNWYTLGSPWSGRGNAILAGSPDPHVATWIADLDFAGHDDLSVSDDPDADADLITAMKNALTPLLSERRAVKESCARLREHNAKISYGLFHAQVEIKDLNKEIARLRALLTANGDEHD